MDRLLASLSNAQRKAIATVIRNATPFGDYHWDGDDSVWGDDIATTLAVCADGFDVSDQGLVLE